MKKIMTVLLSVALLFSFAACDSNAVNPYFGKQVVSVTVSDYPEYVENEVLDPADVVFAVRYDDNTTVNKTGAELGMAPASTQTTGFKLADGYNAFEVKYGTDKEGKPLPAWSAKIVAHQVSSVTIKILAILIRFGQLIQQVLPIRQTMEKISQRQFQQKSLVKSLEQLHISSMAGMLLVRILLLQLLLLITSKSNLQHHGL